MLSIPHLIIIFVVALVVFGPEKLPELARNLGKVMAEFRRATGRPAVNVRRPHAGSRARNRHPANWRIKFWFRLWLSFWFRHERWHNNRRSVACGRFGGWHGSDPASPIGRTHRGPGSGIHRSRAKPIRQPIGQVDQEVRFQPPQVQPAHSSEESANTSEHPSETPTDGGTRPA